MMEMVLDAKRRILGEQHDQTLGAKQNYANRLGDLAQHQEAADLLHQVTLAASSEHVLCPNLPSLKHLQADLCLVTCSIPIQLCPQWARARGTRHLQPYFRLARTGAGSGLGTNLSSSDRLSTISAALHTVQGRIANGQAQ